ncbi:MAG: cytochrome c peroxidase, partial [Pseudomonadota bacterium]
TLLLAACGREFNGVCAKLTPEQAYSGLLSDGIFSAIPEGPVYPADDPFSQAKVSLGEMLFWDPLLSGDRDTACASCHHPAYEWADGRAFSIGVGGQGLGPNRTGQQLTPLHSPSVLNVAFVGLSGEPSAAFVSGPCFWDGRANTLESQAIEPIKNEVEMRDSSYTEDDILPEIINRLERNAEYVTRFASAFGAKAQISEETIARALAAFQRRLTTKSTRFDRFLNGDTSALSMAELEGLNTFIDVGCAACHNGPMLSDYAIDPSRPVIRNKPSVRTPSLRNVAKTAPYMHDGSQPTLSDAIAFYEERTDLEVTLDEKDVAPIESFLKALTDDAIYRAVPAQVPSGLPVGGDMKP